MARTALAIQDVSAEPAFTAAVVFNTSDVANGNMFPNDGRMLLLANNTTGGALILTVESVSDQFGRTGDISTISVAAGAIASFGPFRTSIWNRVTTDIGNVYVDVSGSGLKLAVLKLLKV